MSNFAERASVINTVAEAFKGVAARVLASLHKTEAASRTRFLSTRPVDNLSVVPPKVTIPVFEAAAKKAVNFAKDPVGSPVVSCPASFTSHDDKLSAGIPNSGPAISPKRLRAFPDGFDTIVVLDNGTEEIRRDGTRAWRNNNPGNIRNTPFAQANGSIGEAGGFAVFPNEATGRSALVALLKTDTYQRLSVNAAILRYAPPTENDSTHYQTTLQKKTGIDGITALSTLSESQIDSVTRAIGSIEGWTPGTITTRPSSIR